MGFRAKLPGIATAVTATALSVFIIGVGVVGFTDAEKKTIRQMKQRMTNIETTASADRAAFQAEIDALTADLRTVQDSIDGLVGDIDVLNENDLILSSDIEIIDAGLSGLVGDDGPIAQIDRNLAMTQQIVFDAHPPVELTDITPLVSCNGTTCTVDIEWRSDPPASGQVEWGTDETYGNLTRKQVAPLAYHKQRVGSFPEDGATYHFRVLAEIPELPAVASADMTVALAS